MRLTDAELTTLFEQVKPLPEIREKVMAARDHDRLTYRVLAKLLGEERRALEMRVYRIRKQRDEEELAARPVLVRGSGWSWRAAPRRNGTVNRDHGPLIGLNRFTGQYEEVWLRSPYP